MLRAWRTAARATHLPAVRRPLLSLLRSTRIVAAPRTPCPVHSARFSTVAASGPRTVGGEEERPPETPKHKRAVKYTATVTGVPGEPIASKPKRNTSSASPAAAPPSSTVQPQLSQTFAGATICVSGKFTTGSQGELRELLASHGASLVDTPNASCTHLVCSSLTSAKAKTALGRGIQVVKERWIEESVREGKRSQKRELYWTEGEEPSPLPLHKSVSTSKSSLKPPSKLSPDIEQRVADLRAQIKHADTCYYGSSTPSPLTDAEYDTLYNELLLLEKKHPEMRSPDSPTNAPGAPEGLKEGDRSEVGGVKVEAHRLAMLSLQSCTSEEKVRKWDASLRRGLKRTDGELRYRLELKYDGIAVSTIYRSGKLHSVRTRGTGVSGEDIRAAVERWVGNLPQELTDEAARKCGLEDYVEGEIEIRGEVLLTTSAHSAYTRSMRSLGAVSPEDDGSLAPARNLCAGLLRRETFPTKEEGPPPPLAFIAYSLHVLDGRIRHTTDYLSPPLRYAQVTEKDRVCFPSTQTQALEMMKTMGFDVTPRKTPVAASEEAAKSALNDEASWLCPSIDAAIEVIRRWSVDRSNLDFGIDGVVLKLDSLSLSTSLGATGHHPKAALAFKFPAKATTTRLEDVMWQVGREGKVVPVAVLQPVALDGVTISRASLHNCSVLQSLQLRKGDRVVVERRGDVIPYVAGKVPKESGGGTASSSSSTPIPLPTVCPCALSSPLAARSTASGDAEKFDLFCTSPECPRQRTGRLVHYCSKKALDIDGLGKKTVEALLSEGLLTSLESLLELPDKEEELLARSDAGQLAGWGEKRIRKICSGIVTAHRHASEEQLLIAAGLPRLGRAQAKALIERFGGLENMVRATELDMQGVRAPQENGGQ
jgi:DNA ligase (NAD+)